jgi:hypothetical protein
MKRGAAWSGPDFEISAKVTRASSNTINTNPHPHGGAFLPTSYAATIVSDNQVQSIASIPQLDQSLRSMRVAMDVG